jgi:hypothetical protein
MSNLDLVRKYFVAYKNKDRKAVECLLTNDFVFEKGDEAFILYDCKTKNCGGSRNTEFFTMEGSKIKEIEVYFGSAPKEPE